MAKPIPFPFVLDELAGQVIDTKPMFGAFAVYVDGKIVFILRERESSPRDNGVWLATTAEHHTSLQQEFPSMRSIEVFGPGPTGWQILPVDAEDFEDSVIRACELVRQRDARIGKVPAAKRPAKRAIASKGRGAKSASAKASSSKAKLRAVAKAKPKPKLKPQRETRVPK